MGNGPFLQDTLGRTVANAPVEAAPRLRFTWTTDGRYLAGLVQLAPSFIGPLFPIACIIHLLAHFDGRPLVLDAGAAAWRFFMKGLAVLAVTCLGLLSAGFDDLVGTAAGWIAGLWVATFAIAAVWTAASGRLFPYPLDGFRLRMRRRRGA
ncbi:hypothetical protein [Knoellia subterranea]|uniref:DUF4870 domain-containing protein n=1 Tax=Knoellia subterranea KCTC 19937 TaxID=1385521 RepID=A0A0A0JQK2_9MICO|nr:hypothetical protein [Knoellia subterranea]KGN38317.1 hypothetical protein N803_09620 [Knoellia subterranea KCTC 19937]